MKEFISLEKLLNKTETSLLWKSWIIKKLVHRDNHNLIQIHNLFLQKKMEINLTNFSLLKERKRIFFLRLLDRFRRTLLLIFRKVRSLSWIRGPFACLKHKHAISARSKLKTFIEIWVWNKNKLSEVSNSL